jgi:hypothetical protein
MGVVVSMDYAVEYLPEKGYAKARIAGEPLARDARECVVGLFELAAAHDCKKVLVDGSQVTADSGICDIHAFCSRLEQFGCDRRMSVAVVSQGRPDTDQFIETVARNRGFGLRVFSDPEDAEAWLLGEQVVSV